MQQALGRYKPVVQYIPVTQPGLIQYAPDIGYNRGWEQQYLQTINPPPVDQIVPRVGAPEPQYTLRSYPTLASKAAAPVRQPTRASVQVSAPGINQMLQES